MKIYFLSVAIPVFSFFIQGCNKYAHPNLVSCYKAKLAIKAACMNYTIQVVEGEIDTSLVSAEWTDPQTGKKYINAFALGSRCKFPATIKEGDEFYFSIDNSYVQNCMLCMIYYPTPPKSLRIKVLLNPCYK